MTLNIIHQSYQISNIFEIGQETTKNHACRNSKYVHTYIYIIRYTIYVFFFFIGIGFQITWFQVSRSKFHDTGYPDNTDYLLSPSHTQLMTNRKLSDFLVWIYGGHTTMTTVSFSMYFSAHKSWIMVSSTLLSNEKFQYSVCIAYHLPITVPYFIATAYLTLY